MSVFWIGRTRVHNPEGLKPYAELVQKAASIYRPEVIVRGGAYHVLEGEDRFDRFAVLRFDSMEHALTYYNSPEYQQARQFRHAATTDNELTLVEGVPRANGA